MYLNYLIDFILLYSNVLNCFRFRALIKSTILKSLSQNRSISSFKEKVENLITLSFRSDSGIPSMIYHIKTWCLALQEK